MIKKIFRLFEIKEQQLKLEKLQLAELRIQTELIFELLYHNAKTETMEIQKRKQKRKIKK